MILDLQDFVLYDVLNDIFADMPLLMYPLLFVLMAFIVIFALRFFADFVKIVFQYFFER